MNKDDAPAPDSTPASASDRTGWSQPPAPQSPGPPGAFVDRPAAPPGAPLPPGAGSPVQPGPPLSVQAPIKDTAINVSALLLGVGAVIVVIIVIIVVLILIVAFAHR
jgi:hypothetical protein